MHYYYYFLNNKKTLSVYFVRMTYDCLSLIFLVVAFLSFCCCVAVISLSMCHMSNNVTDLVFPVGMTDLIGRERRDWVGYI